MSFGWFVINITSLLKHANKVTTVTYLQAVRAHPRYDV